MEKRIDDKCKCKSSTGSTSVECCNICGLPLLKETWHFILSDHDISRVEAVVMPNEVVAGGLTEEEQEFMEMMFDCEVEQPEAFKKIKPFAELAISRATLFSALIDYVIASQREA